MSNVKHEPDPLPGKIAVAELVLKDIEERIADGEKKYGTKLQTHNGRNALKDLYQELIDAVMYIRQEIEERNDIFAFFQKLVDNEYVDSIEIGASETLSMYQFTVHINKDIGRRITGIGPTLEASVKITIPYLTDTAIKELALEPQFDQTEIVIDDSIYEDRIDHIKFRRNNEQAT